MKANTTQNQMPFVGVLVRGLMRCQNRWPGHRPVSTEGVQHAGVGRDRCHSAVGLRHERDHEQHFGAVAADGVGPDEHGSELLDGVLRVDGRFRGDDERDGEDENPTSDEGYDDRVDDPLRSGEIGVLRLLRHVGRGVVTGEGVLGHQQADEEDVKNGVEAREVDELREDERGRGVVAGDEGKHCRDDRDAEEVPPDRDVREKGHHPHPEGVQEPVNQEDPAVDDEDVAGRRRVVCRHVQERREEEGKSVVDAGRDRHLAEQVEPAGEPAPGAGLILREFRRPVVQATRRRVLRGDLRHPKADDGRHDPDEDPAPDDVDRAAFLHPEVVEREAPGQDRDDRERDGKVREPAHSAAELLGVAKPMELGYVLINRRGSSWARVPDRCHDDPLCTDVHPSRRTSQQVKGAVSTTFDVVSGCDFPLARPQ